MSKNHYFLFNFNSTIKKADEINISPAKFEVGDTVD